MADTVTPERRSQIMANIKSKNTSIELLVRKRLFGLGFRYRVNYKALPGKPDIVFTRRKKVIFIHGCFWHGHDIKCRYSHTSKSRQDYWEPKISRTIERDKEHIKRLNNEGWKTIVIWECQVKENLDQVIQNVVAFIENKEAE